ncbi:MAG: CPBP family intramembrane metalloprotease [Gammaproteobacteria bacterium]|nr:MAG: CPBP family intramembrane metalloprotease [Gammaproteobacteria bacterium]
MDKQAQVKTSLYPLGFFILTACLASLVGYPLFLALDGGYALERITSKLTLIFLVISIYPLSKFLRYTRADFGFTDSHKAFWKQCSSGFLLGLIILSTAILAELHLGTRVYDNSTVLSLVFISKLIVGALLSGLLIALIEETLFRGLLFRFIRDRSSATFTVLLTALFYAALHFLKSGIDPGTLDETTLITGFKLIALAFANLTNPEIFDSFSALFFVGLFLALIRNQTGSLAQCIGLHASWIFLIKITRSLTNPNPQSEWFFLVGDYDHILGYFVTGWMALVILLYLVYIRKTNSLNPPDSVR